ncbi:hypothetical protein HEK616_53410 [Streptomyces nigrescens]|uniref:Uncharacterized protein n=1 Tax=Streptomyces nigrescens TaxID=1920 RepID=A0ABM7ZZP8_STRNI|nr:hypothetical protein HEK616_53410 [Streptomyces nigrescens]
MPYSAESLANVLKMFWLAKKVSKAERYNPLTWKHLKEAGEAQEFAISQGAGTTHEANEHGVEKHEQALSGERSPSGFRRQRAERRRCSGQPPAAVATGLRPVAHRAGSAQPLSRTGSGEGSAAGRVASSGPAVPPSRQPFGRCPTSADARPT